MKSNANTTIRKPATKAVTSKPVATKTAAVKAAATKPVATKKVVSKSAAATKPASKSTSTAAVVKVPTVEQSTVIKSEPQAKAGAAAAVPVTVERPGAILARKIAATGLTQHAFARKIGCASPRILDLVSGKRRLTADTALRLGRFLNEDPMAWMSYQAAFEVAQAVAEIGDAVSRIEPFQKSGSETA